MSPSPLNQLAGSAVPSTEFKDGAVDTTVSAWASTFRNRTVIALDINPDLPFRALYFGMFVDNAAAVGAYWATDLAIRLEDSNGRLYELKGRRGVATLYSPDPPGLASGRGGRSLPGYAVRVFNPAAQDWADNGVTNTGGIQWVEQVTGDGRIYVIDPAPHYLVGRFVRATLSVGEVLTSGMAGTEEMALFLAVKSSNLPIQ